MDSNGDAILTPQAILEVVQSLTSARKLWIGYSGGIDSHVLLDLMVLAIGQFSSNYEIHAVHVHHGLSQKADAWVQHCEQVCTNLKIPLTVLWVDAKVVNGRSPEEVAREARYSALEEFLQEGDCLLLAHHDDDQAETILLRLFRGSGPLGLGGIPEKASIGKSELIRPLLKISKETILEYARARHLEWIEDDSNINTRFDRNFLRHEIMPLLIARWPRVVRSVSRSGALCLETATAVQVLAANDLKRVKGQTEPNLSVSRLLELELVRRKEVLRYWLYNLGFALPSRDHMERIDREILKARPGSKPKLKISNYEIRRIKDELAVFSL